MADRFYMDESFFRDTPSCIRRDLSNDCNYVKWAAAYSHWCYKCGKSRQFAEDRATAYCNASIQCIKALEPPQFTYTPELVDRLLSEIETI